jgi:hypothetical protein
MLDSQAIYVQVVTNGDDDVDDEAAIDSNSHTKHAEHEGNLVYIVTQGTRPPKGPSQLGLENRTERINDAPCKGDDQHIPVREIELDQVRRDHLAYAVRVYDTGEHDKGDQMLGADQGLQIQVGENESPGAKEGDKSEQSASAAITAGSTSLDDVAGALEGVLDEHDGSLDHVPLREAELVENVGNPLSRHPECREHALLPEAGASHVPGERVDEDKNQNALHRSIHDAERQSLSVILVPRLDVEGAERGKEHGDRVPAVAHVLAAGKEEHLEGRVQRVDAVVEEFTEGAALVGSSATDTILACGNGVVSGRRGASLYVRLRAIHGIKGLVEKQTSSPAVVDPRRAILVQRRIVPEQSQEVGNDEHETRQGNQVGSHGHGEALDDDIGIEGLEDVFGYQRVVD